MSRNAENILLPGPVTGRQAGRDRRPGLVGPITIAAAITLAALGCDSGPEVGPFTTELACPDIESVPFVLDDTSWTFTDNEMRATSQPRHKHQPADLIGNPASGFALTQLPGDAPLIQGGETIAGVMARTEIDRGFFADPVTAEAVSIWRYDEADGWVMLAQGDTTDFTDDVPGSYSFTLESAPPAGWSIRYAVLQPEPSCGIHYTYNLPAATKVIVADIDGTLTLSDDELIEQVSDGTHDPAEMAGSVLLSQTWAEKGYQMIYLTARPHTFRTETRRWLIDHGYAPGPIVTAPTLVSGDTARAYKANWVTRVRDELGWDVVAVYGNAFSDIDAYADAAIPKAVTFIVGENAGVDGTVAIENGDFTTHVQTYVSAQPDA